MRIPITVPDLRCGNEPIRVSGWLIEEGDFVFAGDLVVELLIPGLTIDVVANAAGRLVEIIKPIDSATYVGDLIGWLEQAVEHTA
jgi:pyruvate/2-oxoglutarate dehydrogenase complex dihydrolipoamide acyltransferase (E2) component